MRALRIIRKRTRSSVNLTYTCQLSLYRCGRDIITNAYSQAFIRKTQLVEQLYDEEEHAVNCDGADPDDAEYLRKAVVLRDKHTVTEMY